MRTTRPMGGVTAVETGAVILVTQGPGSWAGVVQVTVTGTLTVAVEGSLDGVTWIKLSSDLTASAMFNVTNSGPVTYLRLKSTAGTGSATAMLCEVS